MQLDFVQSLNRQALEREQVNPGIEGVIESYELAFRMQGEMPKLMDLSARVEGDAGSSTASATPATDDFGRQCLLARRFVEAGVRFVEVCHGGWDQHRNLKEAHGQQRRRHRQADRRPADRSEEPRPAEGHAGHLGRRVRPHAPTPRTATAATTTTRATRIWMAGGGVKGGLAYGQTDDYGYEAVEDKVHIHDWHATILHLLGLDHEKLTYRYAGRDMRLTDVKGNVVKGILA